MLKVLIVGNLPINISEVRGGVTAVIKNLIEGFEGLKIEVHVFSLNINIYERKTLKLFSNVSIHFFPKTVNFSTKLDLLLSRKKLFEFIREIRPDIIHFQGNGSALLLSIGIDKKNCVLTPHAILREELKVQGNVKSQLNNLVVILIEKLFIKKFNNFVFIAEYTKKQFIECYPKILKSNNAVIFNPIANDFFISKNKCFSKSMCFLFVGALIPRKGLHLLLKAFAKYKKIKNDIKLTVIGDFYDKQYKKDILSIISEHNLENQVKFMGWQSPGEVKNNLIDSTIFILPSYQETLPVSIAEAMAMGKVVIASRVGAIDEMIKDKINGFLFDKGDENQLFEILKNLSNYDLIQMGENAKNTAKDNYQASSIAEKTIEFYKKIEP